MIPYAFPAALPEFQLTEKLNNVMSDRSSQVRARGMPRCHAHAEGLKIPSGIRWGLGKERQMFSKWLRGPAASSRAHGSPEGWRCLSRRREREGSAQLVGRTVNDPASGATEQVTDPQVSSVIWNAVSSLSNDVSKPTDVPCRALPQGPTRMPERRPVGSEATGAVSFTKVTARFVSRHAASAEFKECAARFVGVACAYVVQNMRICIDFVARPKS